MGDRERQAGMELEVDEVEDDCAGGECKRLAGDKCVGEDCSEHVTLTDEDRETAEDPCDVSGCATRFTVPLGDDGDKEVISPAEGER